MTTAPVLPIRWSMPLWLMLLVIWTIALLVPVPTVATRTLGPENSFTLAKLLHAGVYAILTLLGILSLPPGRWRWLPVLVLSIHGFATELAQSFVGRGASWRDVGIDHIGVFLGLAIVWYWPTHSASRANLNP